MSSEISTSDINEVRARQMAAQEYIERAQNHLLELFGHITDDKSISIRETLLDPSITNNTASQLVINSLNHDLIGADTDPDKLGDNSHRILGSWLRSYFCSSEEIETRISEMRKMYGPIMTFLSEEKPEMIEIINDLRSKGYQNPSIINYFNNPEHFEEGELPEFIKNMTSEILAKTTRRYPNLFPKVEGYDGAEAKYIGDDGDRVKQRIVELRRQNLLSTRAIENQLTDEGEFKYTHTTIRRIINEQDDYDEVQEKRISNLYKTYTLGSRFDNTSIDEFLEIINYIQFTIYDYTLDGIDTDKAIEASFREDLDLQELFTNEFWKFKRFVNGLINNNLIATDLEIE